MKKIIVIPARFKSTRLKNKLLLDLKGQSILERTYKQCCKVKNIDEIYIATDSTNIKNHSLNFTKNIIMTSQKHKSGTDRIAEAIKNIKCDIVINVQGDEPFIEPLLIEKIAVSFEIDKSIKISSLFNRINRVEELKNSNIVKVILDNNSNAIYFSRSIIPYYRDRIENILKNDTNIPKDIFFYKHLGIYGYKKDFLLKFSNMKESYLENMEKLEQLRVIENGFKIKMLKSDYSSIGIDTIEDYEKALKIVNEV